MKSWSVNSECYHWVQGKASWNYTNCMQC